MDDFARRDPADRDAFIGETAARRDMTPLIIEKDFWVCWTLRRLFASPDLAGHLTFKGGTSLSKAHGIIQRFSEDIDLTIRRTAPRLNEIGSPLDDGLSGAERQRRIKALKGAAQAFVAEVVAPALAAAVEVELGTAAGWSIVLDPDDGDRQTLLFNYPPSRERDASGYIKPRIKLEFGARGDPDPFERREIRSYIAEEFADALPDGTTLVDTLDVARTYWEKATILHALYHGGKMRDGLSRHYYDLLMLDRAGITEVAIDASHLLDQVVRNKRVMFADASAGYDRATMAELRLSPSEGIRARLERDYADMREMFMTDAPTFADLLAGLEQIERRINAAGTST